MESTTSAITGGGTPPRDFVPYNGNQMKGKKVTLELNRYLRERSLRRQPVRFGPIPRNPSPPGNRRAKGLREGRNPPAPRRRYYSPEIEPLLEEDHKEAGSCTIHPCLQEGQKIPLQGFQAGYSCQKGFNSHPEQKEQDPLSRGVAPQKRTKNPVTRIPPSTSTNNSPGQWK